MVNGIKDGLMNPEIGYATVVLLRLGEPLKNSMRQPLPRTN